MSEWQPIETAPRNGEDILVWDGKGAGVVCFMRFQDGTTRWCMGTDSCGVTMFARQQLTHWMPIPEPPK